MISALENLIIAFENQKLAEKNCNRDRGVIYTPQPIADFMVLNSFRIFFDDFPQIQKIFQNDYDETKMKQIFTRNKSCKDQFEIKIRNIKILDPACGTGRYLIAIANLLFKIYKMLKSEFSDRAIKKEIIQNHLYGIEIDESALIVSKIRLISWIYSDDDTPYLDEIIDINSNLSEINRIIDRFSVKFNLFNVDYLIDFNSDDIDIIIGNPPYVENKKILDLEFKNRIKKKFETAYGLYDLSIIFIEKSIGLLKNETGCLSFLTTNKFLSADYGRKIRQMLMKETELKEIINISSLSVFHKTAAYPIIITAKKRRGTNNTVIIKKFSLIEDFNRSKNEKVMEFAQESIKNLPSSVIPISHNVKLVNQLYSTFRPLNQVIRDLKILYRPFGFINWAENVKNISKCKTSDKDLLLIGTGNVRKYHINFKKKIKIAKTNHDITYFKFQNEYKEVWTNLSSEKLIIREIAKDLTCVYDPGVYANLTGLYFIHVPSFETNDYFNLLTILNSDLIDLVFKTLYGTLHMSGGYLRFNGSFIKSLPLPEKIPLALSYIGKILQFLYHLKYEIQQKAGYHSTKGFEMKDILYPLKFYEKLSNSLINQLYLCLKPCDGFFSILDCLSPIPNIEFKFVNPSYKLPNYETYTKEEIKEHLNEINKCFNLLRNEQKLINGMNKYLKYLVEN